MTTVTETYESDAERLWTSWGEGRLCFQTCASCGLAQHPPGPVCSHCHATDLALAESTGDAVLLSWSTVHRAPTAVFEGDVPYTIAVVRIAEGALVELRVVDASAGDRDRWNVGDPAAVSLGVVAGWAMPVVRVSGTE